MSSYLDYKFEDTPELVSVFDELPLWSAPFGLLLLRHVPLKRHLTVVDIGSGAGFPLLELAERLGNSCTCYGIDPWVNADNRAVQKVRNYGVKHVQVIYGRADALPFADSSVDLIVSNLGINNFADPAGVFKECSRALKPLGRLALTTNLKGHWRECYEIFERALTEAGRADLLMELKKEEEHRGTTESVSKLFTEAGLNVVRQETDKFEMRFLDGSAFLNHHFIKLGWLGGWRSIIPEQERQYIFSLLERSLNQYAAEHGELKLTVPMLYMEGEKP